PPACFPDVSMRFSHPGPAPARRDDWLTLKTLWPYVWAFRGRVTLAFICLVVAKVANVATPVWLKDIVDALGLAPTLLAVPLAALLGYGLSRRPLRCSANCAMPCSPA